MNRHLVKSLVNLNIFLEFAPDSVVNEDSALTALENMGAELLKMSLDDQEELVRTIQAVADEYDSPLKEFVIELPAAIGLCGMLPDWLQDDPDEEE